MPRELASVELSRDEIDAVLPIVRARLAELERALQNLEETEGLDAQKWQQRRAVLPVIERTQDVVVKLEAALAELRG